jgi:SET domain-containing protein
MPSAARSVSPARKTTTPSRTAKIRVAESAIGLGVFANRLIPKGEVVGKVRGRVIDDADYSTRYGIDLGDTFTLEPHKPFRYLNHCCEPNCSLQMSEGPSGKGADRSIHVVATRDIQPDQQLYIDYAWSADAAIVCLCGSPKCRGWVVDEDELHLLVDPKPKKTPARKRK